MEQTPGRLTPAQIAASREALARLKFHPREALPNPTALARADALYVELVGRPREILGEAIAAFRAVMEGQDTVEIEQVRSHLLDLIADLAPPAAG